MKKYLKKKLVALFITLALAATFLVACGGPETASTDSKADTTEVADTSISATEQATENKDLKPLRLGCGDATTSQLNDLARVAQKKGYLEEELNNVGYTLETAGFAGQGPEIVAAIASDSLDGGNIAEFPVLTSNASGIKTTVVAVTDSNLAYGILVAKDDIVTVKDLEGKKIVVQAGTALQYVWEQIVAETGIDTSNIEVINANVVDGISLVQTGDADAVLSSATSVESTVKKGFGHVVEGIPATAHSTTLISLTDKLLAESPEVAVAINKALIRTYEYVLENPDEFYKVVGEAYGEVGPEIAKSAYEINGGLEYISPEFTDDVNAFYKATYDWMKANGILKADVDVNKVFDSSYYEKAVEELDK